MKIYAVMFLFLTLISTSANASPLKDGDLMSDGTFTHAGFIHLCSLPEKINKDTCLLLFSHAKQALSMGILTVNMQVLKVEQPMFYCMNEAAKYTGSQLLEDFIHRTKDMAETPQGKQQAMSSIVAQYLAAIFPASSC